MRAKDEGGTPSSQPAGGRRYHEATSPMLSRLTLRYWAFSGSCRGIPVDEVKKFEPALKRQGNKVEIVIYPEAGHGFENPNNKTGYHSADAADAWKHTTRFLTVALKK